MSTNRRGVEYEMVTAANDDRIMRIRARLTISGELATRLFNERKLMSGSLRASPDGPIRADALVEIEKRHVAVFSARPSEMIRGDGVVVFLPKEPDHTPDAYVGGLTEARVNGESVGPEVLEEVLSEATPPELVAEVREAMAKLTTTYKGKQA